MLNRKKGFTLVELIIVVTILIILGTIAFINLGDYPMQARDSARKVDLKNIEKALELYKIENGTYPAPSNQRESEFVGWLEGELGEEITNLRFGKFPKDPLTGKNYDYSVSDKGDAYRLVINYELEGKKIIGDVIENCEQIFEKGLFAGNKDYRAYSSDYRPVDIFCHDDYKNVTFYEEVKGGDFEVETSVITSVPGKLIFSEEEASTGTKSLKMFGGLNNVILNDFIYVDETKIYELSVDIKTKLNGSSKATNNIGFVFYDENFREITGGTVKVLTSDYKINGTRLTPGKTSLKTTKLTRPVSKNAREIYFECDNDFYLKLKDNLEKWIDSRGITVAFNAKEDLSDLPNFELATRSGALSNNARRYAGRVEKTEKANECKFYSSINSFYVRDSYDSGTEIRFHSLAGVYNLSPDFSSYNNWKTNKFIISGFSEFGSEFGKFRKGTKFIKIIINGNLDFRYLENGNSTNLNNISETFIDNISFVKK